VREQQQQQDEDAGVDEVDSTLQVKDRTHRRFDEEPAD